MASDRTRGVTLITVTLNTSVDRTVEVPRFAVGGHLKGRLARLQPAGKGVNVSRCLDSLGVPSVATGFVGAGETALYRDSLAATRAEMRLVPIAGTTRSNTTILDPVLGTDTHIREAGPTVRPEEVESLRATLAALALPEAVAVFCGSLPPGVTADDVARLMAACRDAGARVAADLNGPQLGVAVAAEALLIKPNVEELGELVGRDLSGAGEAELLAAARPLCDRVGTVLLTRGREGAMAVRQADALACSVEVPRARNTVGCGDAFLAGYLAGLWRGVAADECLRLAVACGAANALTDAAGQIDPAQVRELADRAELRRVG